MKRTSRFPILGASVPRRGNLVSRALARMAFRAAGWSFDGQMPDLAKAVLIVAPHTSNWDFLVGITAVYALGVRLSFLGKHSLFRRPFGVLMRWLGGIAVDRRASSGAVSQVAARFRTADALLLGMSPEGTRKSVERWRTGFYYIAIEAGVSIVPIAFDYPHKTIRFFPPLSPSGDLQVDLGILDRHFAGVLGKRDRS